MWTISWYRLMTWTETFSYSGSIRQTRRALRLLRLEVNCLRQDLVCLARMTRREGLIPITTSNALLRSRYARSRFQPGETLLVARLWQTLLLLYTKTVFQRGLEQARASVWVL